MDDSEIMDILFIGKCPKTKQNDDKRKLTENDNFRSRNKEKYSGKAKRKSKLLFSLFIYFLRHHFSAFVFCVLAPPVFPCLSVVIYCIFYAAFLQHVRAAPPHSFLFSSLLFSYLLFCFWGFAKGIRRNDKTSPRQIEIRVLLFIDRTVHNLQGD